MWELFFQKEKEFVKISNKNINTEVLFKRVRRGGEQRKGINIHYFLFKKKQSFKYLKIIKSKASLSLLQ
jgi:hypothetical protein